MPPELLADSALRFPPVLFARGTRDEWLTQPRFDSDMAALTGRGVRAQSLLYEGAHEWTADVARAAGVFLENLS